MKTLISLFAALLLLSVSWGLGYHTGRADGDAELYASGYEDGYSDIVKELNQ